MGGALSDYLHIFNSSVWFCLTAGCVLVVQSVSRDICYFSHCCWRQVNQSVNVISPSTTCSWINLPGILDQPWNNFPVNQSDLRDKFTVYVKLEPGWSSQLKHQCYSPFITLWFREKLWVGLGLGVGIGLHFGPGMLIQDHVLLGKITVTPINHSRSCKDR